ncbi:ubiquitin carboxyl-terminal hydrolase [Blastocystis sp. ATCC 50177/Nand II]|uniref:Ubiquitin carboxyl-terminal hydrolase n=1 Tax=Blastocystis sp. subtype 1 (strain ATCC 50177 / NandII) TaxID=478820 RepID=A0A196SEJ6_BLAHN|nr:ubiquitin carboxyl-terminal hydrolase [Blastocystis sp. ATCC 50177/Nand II]
MYENLCKRLVNDFIANPDAEPFLHPVPWKEWNLLDYPTIVKVPMDLSTVKTKLENREYGDAYSFAADMRLIWSNCLLYNPEGTEIRVYAQKLQGLFEDKFRQLVNQLPEDEKMPSVEKRREFAQSFNQLSAAQITHIVECVTKECPNAIETTPTGKIDIVVDKMRVSTLRSLLQYEEECMKE